MERETRNDGLLEIFPRIPNYTGRVVLFEGEIPIHEDKFNWVFYPKGQKREIPVYSIWNYDNNREITELIARGKAAALYMWGTYGTGMLLDSPQWQEEGEIESEKLRRVKKNRPWGDQFIDFMHPDDMIDFWDIDRFHPNFHRLQWAGDRWQLFEAGPVHIIAPTKPRNPHIDPSLFRESNQTSSYFFLPHPALIGLIELIRKDVKHSIFGGGSLNIHGESPPFTTEELHTMLSLNEDWQQDIDLVIVDEITEFYEIFRSQLQIRIPQRGCQPLGSH